MSRLSEAADELYSADPGEFTARRKELAARARAAGDRAAAKDIAALAKPTRSAWLVNQLVRTDPSVPARLAELGDQLRAGEAALDGPSIRKLSVARRELVDALTRQAVAASGVSATLRDEVIETLNAALADPEVAARVAAGTLVRAAHWAGFGPGIGTATGAEPGTAPARPADTAAPASPAKAAAIPSVSRRQQAQQAAADAALAVQGAAATERARQQAVREIEIQIADHREQLARNEQGVLQAQRELALAQRNLADIQLRLAETEQSLATARQDLKAAGAQARQAVAAQRKAQQALDRLRG
ncbi:MAG TPA: hypothetical protein VN695_20985 [Streptosporangiaceae bacterium]|nr:hypothetical protein [Streptosporangiaceae bacterium]